MANILIIGCGDIGAALGQKLAEQGHQVSGLKRSVSAAQNSKINYIQADVTKRASLVALSLDYDQVVYILSPSSMSLEAYQDVFQIGVENVLSVFAEKCPQASFVFVSSTRVYAQTKGEWLDEKSITAPQEPKGQLLLAAEKQFLNNNPTNTVVRFSGIYGRGTAHFLKQIQNGAEIQQSPAYYTNRIHKTDCVGVLSFLLNKKISGDKLAPVYAATDSDPVSKWDIASYLAKSMQAAEPIAISTANNANLNKRISNKLLLDAGYIFNYPSYKTGYQSSLRDIINKTI